MAKSYEDGSGLVIKTNQKNLDSLVKNLTLLADVEVLVGFPEDTTTRTDDSVSQGITNATLGYIHDNGAPEQNIPARPFMLPGMAEATGTVTDKLAQVLKAVSQGKGPSVIEQGMTHVGLIAKLAIQNTINAGLEPPLSPRTIASRSRSRGTDSQRLSELEHAALTGKGIDEGFLQGALGIKPLINTGQLRNAVNYVIRSRRKRSK